MRKLLAAQAAISVLASWALVAVASPADKQVRIKVEALTPEIVERDYNQEKALRDAGRILARYNCPSDVVFFVARASVDFHLRAALVASTLVTESSCRADAQSEAGAYGYMQVMPRVWSISRQTLRDPETSIRTGTRILSTCVRRYGEFEGARHYFGVTGEGMPATDYAERVLSRAR